VRSRTITIIRNVLLTVAILVLGFVFLYVPWFFARRIAFGQYHYPDPNDGRTPKSYNLDFRWVDFPSSDGIPLKGWYIPAEGQARGTIVYCHGWNRTRVEMLPEAVFGHQAGYNGLLFDFRHEGMSGGSVTTLGYQERFDVVGAVKYALEQNAARPIVVWGISMGASAGLLAASESPDISAVIADSSFDSLLDTIRHHVKLFFRIPGFPLGDEVAWLVARHGNFAVRDFDVERGIERAGDTPILVIAASGDRRMPPALEQKLYDHSRSPLKKFVVLHANRHGEAFNQATDAYESAVTEFLSTLPRRR
jgi:pimeloyl-ACP methyl ester carboxylesterase